MKGDFTRGIQPDRKRGKRYRRVLVQQSRVLVDSDVAALVDAFDTELRKVTADLGCDLGSPDYGYLITPGRLLALFEHTDHVTTTSPADAVRDYQRKYPEEPEARYPSLRIDGVAAGNSGPPGTVTIPFVEPLAGPVAGNLAFWYRADTAVTITIAAGTATTNVALAAVTQWTRATAPIAVAAGATLNDITITGDAAASVWIALVELDETRDTGPHFWAAAGRFHAHGLTPELAHATGYPEVSFPASAGFPASDPTLGALADNSRIVAYLETWERDITAAEDPGIREVALGKVDTTVRTQVIGQVKWASVGSLTADEIRHAFEHVAEPASELEVSAPTTPPSSDPCALPTSGGYTGADHRFYRFEVHVAGDPMNARIKWSRDNACHVFPVREIVASRVTLDRNSGLADGDIVEILSEVVDLGNAAIATVNASGVTPARRSVGILAVLQQEDSDAQGRDVFTLRDHANTANPIDPATADPARYPTVSGQLVPLRLRRWDDVATPRTVGTNVVATIEDGIEITLAGSFEPGEYWQFEARRGQTNDNGPWQKKPHGPERILAPLALLDIKTPTDPMFLEAWLDDRFSSLCELDADDIEFDGDRVGTDADTVQEAIEELYERDAGNCCDATLGPNGRTQDDALRITNAINASTFPSGGHLCLEAGIYDIRSTIVINKDVVIRGCPEATLLADGSHPIFEITPEGRLRIEQLILYNGPRRDTPATLVQVHGGGSLIAREVGFLGADATVAIAMPGAKTVEPDLDAVQDPPNLDPDNLPPREDSPAFVELRDCVLISANSVVGTRFGDFQAERSAFVFAGGGISADHIDRLVVHDCAFRSGLQPAFFGNQPGEQLRGRVDNLLTAAASLPPGFGFGISVQFVLGGSLERNHSNAFIGFWARVARELAIRGDEIERIEARSTGIRFHHARSVEIEAARITGLFGIEVPLSARRLTIRRCELIADGRAITVAGEQHELVNAGSFVGVLIEGNHVRSRSVGIVIGASGTQAAEVDDVRIAGNVVHLDATGTAATGIIAIGDGNLTSAIVVDANDVTTNQLGIRIAGSGCVIRGNQIRLASNGPAISALGKPVIGQVVVADNVIAGINNSFAAIQLDGVPDARVTTNQVRTTAAYHATEYPTALHLSGASASLRHYVVGNDFAQGSINITNAHNLHLVGNSIRVLAVDSGATGSNGVVHGNQIDSFQVFIIVVSASLTGLRGRWKISDNLASGWIVIRGASHTFRFPFFANTSNAVGLHHLADHVLGAGTLPPAVAARIGVAAPATTAVAGNVSDTSVMRSRVLSSDARRMVATDDAIADIRHAAELDALAPVFEHLDDNRLVFPLITIVEKFDFHVSGNRCLLLQVESANGDGGPSDCSAQVVDNKVDLSIGVQMSGAAQFDHVIANNSALSYNTPIASQLNPILFPNLRW